MTKTEGAKEFVVAFVANVRDVDEECEDHQVWRCAMEVLTGNVDADTLIRCRITPTGKKKSEYGYDTAIDEGVHHAGTKLLSDGRRIVERVAEEGLFDTVTEPGHYGVATDVLEGPRGRVSICKATHPAVMIRRCMLAMFEKPPAATMRVEVNFEFRRGAARFVTELPTADFADPRSFHVGDVRCLLHAATDEYDADKEIEEQDLEDEPAAAAFADGDEVHGDVGTRAVSVVESYPALVPKQLADVCFSSLDATNNASLQPNVSSGEKYGALAGLIENRKKKDPDGYVVIVGDHPGTLARSLLNRGYNVWGVDPKNIPCVEKRRKLEYHQRRGLVDVVKGKLLWADDQGMKIRPPENIIFAVVDTSNDKDTAEQATARNVRIADKLGQLIGKDNVILQARSRPFLKEEETYDCVILDLPGHSNQGGEVFVMPHVPDSSVWERYAWASIVDEPDGEGTFVATLSSRTSVDVVLDTYFERSIGGDPHSWTLPGEHWFSLVVTRAFIKAARDVESGFGRAAMLCKSPMEALALLETTYPSQPGDTNKFDVPAAQLLPGITPGLFNRYEYLRGLVAARYVMLTTYTRFEVDEAPDDVKKLFATPSSGVLLRRLSRVRECHTEGEWGGPIIARYKRVLPYELMAVLAHRPVYNLVYQYVVACSVGLNKPLHAWELQFLLWTLTMHGSDTERYRFLSAKMSSAMRPVNSARTPQLVATTNIRDLIDFDNALRDLGILDKYHSVDPEYARAAGASFNTANAGNATMRRYGTPASSAQRARPDTGQGAPARAGRGSGAVGSARGYRAGTSRLH